MTRIADLTETQYFEKLVLAKAIQFEDIRGEFMTLPEYFEDARHGNIANIIIQNINITYEELITKAVQDPKQIGDYDFVRDIVDMDVVTKHSFLFEQEQILKAYKVREIDKKVAEYQTAKGEETIQAISAEIERLNKLRLTQEDKKQQRLVKQFNAMFSDEEDPILKTGFDTLDSLIDGIEMNQLNIIAARPSMGKTAFALQMAINMQNENTEIIFCSAETTAEKIDRRILSNLSKVPIRKFKSASNFMTMEDIDNVTDAIGYYSNMNITVEDEAIFTPNKIRQLVHARDEDTHKIVFIDYLQLMHTDSKVHMTDTERVSEISRDLKILATGTPNLTIVALSQLSRSVESRQDKRPTMGDLRQSGQIEQDAEMIMFLYRDDYYNPSEDLNLDASDVEVILGKNKDGQQGTARIQYFKDIQRLY
jgi:replicative DNA helicase